MSCACSAAPAAGTAMPSGSYATGAATRTGRPARNSPAGSASARPCSWTTPSAGGSTSTPRAWGCRSPGIPWSAPPGCSTWRSWSWRWATCSPARTASSAGSPPAPSGRRRARSSGTRRPPRSTRSRPRRPARAGSTHGPGRTRRRAGSGRGRSRAGTTTSRRTKRREPRPCVLLSARLGRALNITQGRGSQILTAPAPDGSVEIGGRVVLTHHGQGLSGPRPSVARQAARNTSPSSRNTAVFSAKARLHSSTIRRFSRSSAFTASSSSR